MVGSQKVMGKSYVNTEASQIVCIGAIFNSTYHMKQLNPWLNSPASCMMIYGWFSAYKGEMEPFKHHPSTRECLKCLRNKP